MISRSRLRLRRPYCFPRLDNGVLALESQLRCAAAGAALATTRNLTLHFLVRKKSRPNRGHGAGRTGQPNRIRT